MGKRNLAEAYIDRILAQFKMPLDFDFFIYLRKFSVQYPRSVCDPPSHSFALLSF